MDTTSTISTNPTNTNKMTPKDFFLNLGWFVSLYGSIISFLCLIFGLINYSLVDALNFGYYGYSYELSFIRSSLAWFIIVFPVYLGITLYMKKLFVLTPEKRELRLRKWFIYLTLFLSSITIVIDLIVLLNKFLDGEISSRFIWKVIATLLTAVLIFTYYIYQLKTETSRTASRVFLTLALVIFIGSLTWAFYLIGSPGKERLRRFDEQKVSDLGNIQWQIINYWQSKGTLPTDLNSMFDNLSSYSATTEDPQTHEPYVYNVINNNKTKPMFSLCANFNLPSIQSSSDGQYTTKQPARNDNWSHPAGKKCFERTIDIDLYPVRD